MIVQSRPPITISDPTYFPVVRLEQPIGPQASGHRTVASIRGSTGTLVQFGLSLRSWPTVRAMAKLTARNVRSREPARWSRRHSRLYLPKCLFR